MATVTDPRKIERVTLTYADDVQAELRGDVLRRAHKHFGYCADAFRSKGPLAAALSELGIQPLRTEQVIDYMNSKARTVRINFAYLFVPLALSLIPTYFLICHAVYGNWDIAGVGEHSWSVVCVLFGIVGTIVWGVLGTAMAAALSPLLERKSSWCWYVLGKTSPNDIDRKIDRYPRYVPVHVLNLAVQIKETVPEAEFYVRELQTITNKLGRPHPDPFLWVGHGPERYWIAVWDEREFEAKA